MTPADWVAASAVGLALAIAILMLVARQRNGEVGFATMGAAYLFWAAHALAALLSVGSIATLLDGAATLVLFVGLLSYLRGHERRLVRDLSEIAIWSLAGAALAFLLPERLVAHIAVIEALLFARVAWRVARLAPRNAAMGYKTLALALLLQTVVLLAYIGLKLSVAPQLGEVDLLALRSIAWLILGMTIVSITGSRARARLQQELDARVKAEREIQLLVYRDELTGLASRHAVREHLTRLVIEGAPFSLLAINLREFHQINADFGHDGGNLFLHAFADLLTECLDPAFFMARSGGDEFLIVAVGEKASVDLEKAAAVVRERLRRPVRFGECEIYVVVAAGQATFPEHGQSVDELIRNLGMAVRDATAAGGSVLRQYRSQMQSSLHERMWMDQNLRAAIAQDGFFLNYQPKVRLRDGGIIGVEALIRWAHPDRGRLDPATFVNRAEANGTIILLGRWALAKAASQAERWSAAGLPLRVAVNISARQLKDPELFAHLAAAQSVARGLLDLEVTEKVLWSDEEAALRLIEHVRSLGYGVHLDDFGTGYSSLSQIARMPLDAVKIDQSFIQACARSARGAAIVSSMAAAARALGRSVIAEGVESQAQVDLLREIGVEGAQGWFFAPGLDPAEVRASMVVEGPPQAVIIRLRPPQQDPAAPDSIQRPPEGLSQI